MRFPDFHLSRRPTQQETVSLLRAVCLSCGRMSKQQTLQDVLVWTNQRSVEAMKHVWKQVPSVSSRTRHSIAKRHIKRLVGKAQLGMLHLHPRPSHQFSHRASRVIVLVKVLMGL
mmetsp:Transcript_12388/g.33299  ORF Transcript_12388/g.33299 Transcript_12388/m.33299 type:complete len:115 (-) Transcript_12388:1719-2063(-)